MAKRVCIGSVVMASLLAAGCGSRPEEGFLAPVAEIDPGSTAHTLLVATTRKRDDRPGTLFNGERSTPLDFAKIVVSVPEKHAQGEVEWASTAPGSSKTDFVVRQANYLDDEKAFVSTLNAQLAARPKGKRNVFLFIHGYNTMFAEGLYRFAQVVHDAQAPGVPVLFTWASRGQVTQYVYDTNSATAARDDLERTIRLLFASNAEQVNILAHSMGNWVTVEALRQIRISGGLPHVSKLGRLVLAAPDIDIDVFKSQMRRFGKPAKPFFIVLSKDDKALGASNFLAGGTSRLGAASDSDELAALGAIVVDMTDVKGLDSSNHGKFAQLAAVAPRLNAVLEGGFTTPRSSANAEEIASGSLEAIVKLPITIIGAPFRLIAGR
ncbi:alpha/beta hydrolase [Bosea sp. 124]|uniref:alpha/beta hydrolase n=1 Tax=Bosea sp. 124 TaxID=2135642 RepID=UPI0020BE4780|nr:alpha/beta hydrolase [Bosea sp. 124]